VDQFGYQGAAPLLLGTLRVLNRSGLVPGDITPLALEWETQIPRSVGLAGSSALVIATLRACAAAWEIQLAPTQVASLAIDVERDELGIGAGWMDRVVQARDVPCLVRCATEPPEVTESVPAAFDVVVAWDPRGAAPSGRLHGPLKQRWLNGDSDVVEAVNELSALATQAHAAWAAPDRGPLCTAIDATLEVRRRIAATDAHTLELVELARRAGAAATNAGSGGAIAAVCRESGPAARKRLTDHLSAAGIPWCVAGSVETP
jgi:glucuronokinase